MIRIGSILQTSWDWRAAGNFILGGTGGGLMLVLAAASYPGRPPLLTGLTGLALIGLGLFLVWLEIGRPWRFIHVYFHPQTSWMTREAITAMVLFPIALLALAMDAAVLTAAAGVLGLGFVYCQARILHASRGIPAWRDPAILPLIIGTGLTEGAGLLIVLAAASSAAPGWVPFLFVALLVLRGCAWVVYRQNLAASKAPGATLAALARAHGPVFMAGNVVPLGLTLLALLVPALAGGLSVLAALLAIGSGWYMKFIVVTRAAQVQGYSVGRLRRGRPVPKSPVRRQPDRFVA